MSVITAGSSSGRIADSESVHLGSNTSPATKFFIIMPDLDSNRKGGRGKSLRFSPCRKLGLFRP